MTFRVRSQKTSGKTEKHLSNLLKNDFFRSLDKYGRAGVDALSSATPVDDGTTSNSWDYRIVKKRGSHRIEWFNTNVVNGVVIAIILQYGHGTGTGGYVSGLDYINPAARRIFEEATAELWERIKR